MPHAISISAQASLGHCHLVTSMGQVSATELLRVVEPVFISARYTDAGETRYIVEKEQTFPDGRVRPRTMLVAEKKRGRESWVRGGKRRWIECTNLLD